MKPVHFPAFFRVAMALLLVPFSLLVSPASALDRLPTGGRALYPALGTKTGPVDVVVELVDLPAAQVYAAELAFSKEQAVAAARKQVALLRQRQADWVGALAARGVQVTELYRTQRAYNGIWLRVDARDVRQLAAQPGVVAVHSQLPKVIDDSASSSLVGAVQAWAGSGLYQGQGVRIGVIDTGIDYRHAMFGGQASSSFPTAKVVGGYDFVGDSYSGSNSTPQPDADPMDCNGHGTHVAGSAAGYGILANGSAYVEAGADTYASLAALSPLNYQQKFYIAPGVAPRASLYALRIFGCQGGTNLVSQAIEWAMDPNDDGDLSDHLDVINLSLGSSYGTEYDADAVAANTAAQAGVIVVTSAGNAGDVFYIASSPGVARYAISVASSGDADFTYRKFSVVSAPSVAAGDQVAGYAVFGPKEYDLTAALAIPTPADACSTIAENLTGKIALVDQGGSCSDYLLKAQNAQASGAVGVLVVGSSAGNPPMLSGIGSASANIPVMTVSQATGAALKADLQSGAVTVRLFSSAAGVVSDPANEDVVSSYSSRGVARVDARLKPDLAAPGGSIFSAQAGTARQGITMSGTSMAAPHVAGAMALLRQAHPTWTVAELKALVMNSASSDVWSSSAKTQLAAPSRVGAGRLNLQNALASPVIAYNKNDPGQVSLSFGQVAVVNTQSFVQSALIQNFSASPITYHLDFSSRYEPNPGLVFSILDAGGSPVSDVLVPAGSSVEIKLRAALTASALSKALDPTLATGARQRFSEGGGYLVLTAPGQPDLRLPVHIAPRPASMMSMLEDTIQLGAASSGVFQLHPNGVGVASYGGAASQAQLMNLMAESPNDDWSTGPVNAADLRYVGLAYDPGTERLTFGLVMHDTWDTPSSNILNFFVLVDIDEDASADYFLTNSGPEGYTDEFSVLVCDVKAGACETGAPVNGLDGDTNTNLFDNNLMTFGVDAADIGLNPGNTNFYFQVETYSRDFPFVVDTLDTMIAYDIASQPFTPATAGMFPDDPALSPTVDVVYDKNALAARGSLGLLVLHFGNPAGTTAEVISIEQPLITSIMRTISSAQVFSSNVTFQVTFSEPVWNVDASDFVAYPSVSLKNATVSSVSGSNGGTSYVVTVGGYTGSGFLRLDVRPTATIEDLDGLPFSGGYYKGQNYVILTNQTFTSNGTYDGLILESSETSNLGGSFNNNWSNFYVGDGAADKQYRAILSFDTSALPDTAILTLAQLKIRQAAPLVGDQSPFSWGQYLRADICRGWFGSLAALQLSDFNAFSSASCKNNLVYVGSTPASGWYAAQWSSVEGLGYINQRGLTQVRLRFGKDDNDDGAADYLRFYSGNLSGIASRPQLIIRYYVP